jgi:hypothetical protein
MADAESKVDRPRGRRVYVIGGGVAGLTAAHELVDRGFRVILVEDGRLGGLARTQWCYGNFVEPEEEPTLGRSPRKMEALEPMAGQPGFEAAVEGSEVFFARGSFELDEKALATLEALVQRIAAYYAAARPNPGGIIYHRVGLEANAREEELLGREDAALEPPVGRYGITEADANLFKERTRPLDSRARTLSRLRALVIKSWLGERLAAADHAALFIDFLAVGLGGGLPEVFGSTADAFAERMQGGSVKFRIYDPKLPGEHGYRYFPAFYRHVFDSMRKTWILEPPRISPLELLVAREVNMAEFDIRLPPERHVESTRTVMDNLVPTRSFKIAVGDREGLIEVPRARARSFRELSRLVRSIFRRFHVDARDLARFQLKMAHFMTSCPARRKTYEAQTWAAFLGAERASPAFREIIERWPQALIGIRAGLADARTIGAVAVQLLLDQLSMDGVRDATLNGPTSAAWIEPWKTFLEHRGVVIVEGRLVDLKLANGRVIPVFRDDTSKGVPLPETRPADYLVLAVPLREARRLVASLWDSLDEEARKSFPEGLRKVRDFLGEPLPESDAMPVGKDGETGSLRHYSGIQFYLSYDLGPADGHIYLARSDWRLSAIAQAQFWQRRLKHPGPAEGVPGGDYISVLSVDIGDWFAPSRRGGLRASECSREQLAAEVWQQIVEGISTETWSPSAPLAYHIDDDMIFGANGKPSENRAPYLVNLAGGWEKRPGPDDLTRGYEVFYKNLVVAGTFMKTYTRLATMESANESARHAVNGILEHYRKTTGATTSRACEVWNPEEHELDDLDFLKEIDARLMELGEPHLLEILDVEALLDGGIEVPTPDAILTALLRSLGVTGASTTSVAGLSLSLVRRALEVLFG